MKYGNITVEKKELDLLKQIMGRIPNRLDEAYRASISALAEELKKATVVAKKDMPADVVRLNSTVTIEDRQGRKHQYQLVTPERGNVSQKKISIIAPMGLALYGYAQDDTVEWQFPAGVQTFKILKVVQENQLNTANHDA